MDTLTRMQEIIMKKRKRSHDAGRRIIAPTESDQLKKSIIKTRDIIRKKFRDLHNEKQAVNQKVTETLQPIIEPLQTISKREKQEKIGQNANIMKVEKEEEETPLKKKTHFRLPDSVFKTAIATHRDKTNLFDISQTNTSSHNLSGFSPIREHVADDLEDTVIKRVANVNSPNVDPTYGFKYKNGQLMLGKDNVVTKDTPSGTVYQIKKKEFPATPGVTELLTSDHPKQYKDEDLDIYKEMLVQTSAHKKNHVRNGQIIRSNSSWKYNNILSSLFPEKKSGRGFRLPQIEYKVVKGLKKKNNNINYTYWDNPNELVDRLRLLLSSASAGHTGHTNEIISIIEELREANIIH